MKDYKTLKKLVLVKLHPDKGGNAEDFKYVMELREKLNNHIQIKSVVEQCYHIVYKTAFGIKLAGTIVDVLRVVNQPTLENGKQVVFDTVHIYGMYKGLNGYGLVIGGLEASYQTYQGEYAAALKHVATTAVYMVLPMVIAATGVPYIGLVFALGMTAYSAYYLMSNTHALYIEYTSEDNAVKSSETDAYSNPYSLLASTPLRYVYEFDDATESNGWQTDVLQEESETIFHHDIQ